MQENHLAKWLNDELTADELAEFKRSKGYATYKRILETANTIEPPVFDEDQAMIAIKNRRLLKEPKLITMAPYKKFLRVAAAVIILIMGAYMLRGMLDEKITTQYAETKTVVLPDNSEVVLNAATTIAYDKKNWHQDRNVTLNGEAFFKVAKGERFTVHTGDAQVTVLGTQFNVEHRKGVFEVTCFEGLVSVVFNGKETKLPAGSSFMAINGKEVANSGAMGNEPSWLHQESTFKSMPLKFVLEEFERQHNIQVTTQNVNTDQLFTGTFSNTDAEVALKSISVPTGIKFKLEGKKVLFHGDNAK